MSPDEGSSPRRSRERAQALEVARSVGARVLLFLGVWAEGSHTERTPSRDLAQDLSPVASGTDPVIEMTGAAVVGADGVQVLPSTVGVRHVKSSRKDT